MRWMNSQLVGVLGALACVTGVQAESHQVTVIKNVDYLPGVDYPDGKDRLDLYVPKGVTNVPVIVSLHGGALSQGDRAEEVFVGQRFATAGCHPDRRSQLSPLAGSCASCHIQDVAAAFAWVKRHAGEHGGDSSRIMVIGHSAGAYLAALLATDSRYLAAHKLFPADIRGIVGVSGFYWVDKPGVAPDRPKDVWGPEQKVWVEASPARYLRCRFAAGPSDLHGRRRGVEKETERRYGGGPACGGSQGT